VPKINRWKKDQQFLAMVENRASNWLHSSYSRLISAAVSQPASIMSSIQYWVSLASLSQIFILFLKSALLLDRLASR
jgi:hypothetical protein